MGSIGKVDFDTPPTETIKPIVLAHVVLRTNINNLKKMKDFYLTFLGATVSHENDMLCFMTYDDEHHRIALIGLPDLPPKVRSSCGLEHVAFTYTDLTTLMLSYRQKLKAGIKPDWCVNHGPTVSLYYRDPDGNMLENQVDCFDTAEAATSYMTSAEFAENPIGVDFDPEEMIERIKKGESEEALKHRPNIGPRSVPADFI